MSHSVSGLSAFSHSIAIIISFPKIRAKTVQNWENITSNGKIQWCSLPMGYNGSETPLLTAVIGIARTRVQMCVVCVTERMVKTGVKQTSPSGVATMERCMQRQRPTLLLRASIPAAD